jgi:hypothetical protein
MFLVAKEIGLPDYVIETRHACTHKNLPSYNILLFTIQFLFFWIKKNMWEKQYKIFILEKKIYEDIIQALNKRKSPKKNNKNKEKIKLEINHLFDIIVKFFTIFKENVEYKNKNGKNHIVLNNEIDFLIDIYQLLLQSEGEFLILLFYQFIIEQCFIIISNNENQKYEEFKNIIIFFTKFITKYNIIKKFNFDTYEILYQANFSKIKFINSLCNNEYEEISNCFSIIFQGFKEREGYENILDYQNVVLYRLGYIIDKNIIKEKEIEHDNLEKRSEENNNFNNIKDNSTIEIEPINTLIL